MKHVVFTAIRYTVQKILLGALVASAVTAVLGLFAPEVFAGTDAGGYVSQQAMQQGTAQVFRVLSVRQVAIEQQQTATGNYVATATGAALGGIAGSAIDKPGSSGRSAAMILGGLLGGIAGNMLADTVSSTPVSQGLELTLIQPETRQVIVVVQGGQERFSINESVLVIQMGGTVRVTAAPASM